MTRLTRAAMFAGAALLVPACGGGADATAQGDEQQGTGGGEATDTHAGDTHQNDTEQDGVAQDRLLREGPRNPAMPYGAPPRSSELV